MEHARHQFRGLRGEREMVTYEEVLPVTAESLLPEDYQADAFVVSMGHADPAWLAGLHRLAPLVFADVAWDDERLASPRFLDDLAAVDVFMPNAAEALACTRCETIEQAAGKLASEGPLVVVKDGAAGSLADGPGRQRGPESARLWWLTPWTPRVRVMSSMPASCTARSPAGRWPSGSVLPICALRSRLSSSGGRWPRLVGTTWPPFGTSSRTRN